MLPFDPTSINLLRYLLVLEVNQPIVALPYALSVEMSYVLGTMITERLPTSQVKLWRKMQAEWEEVNTPNPQKGRQKRKHKWPLTPPSADWRGWPLELVWLPYQVKQSYGEGEQVLCELKLLGESASHPLFLELILPVLEAAGVESDGRWKRNRSLWGRYNLRGVYVARGKTWEPVAENGRLDFEYRPTPNQWAEGLTWGDELGISATELHWLTPFAPLPTTNSPSPSPSGRSSIKEEAPSMNDLLHALTVRLDEVAPNWLTGDERETAVADMLALAEPITSHNKKVKASPKEWPGTLWGQQKFTTMPPALLPYLELASILHIGRQTHFGCGTFRLF